MPVQHKHRTLVAKCLENLYAKGIKVPIETVEPGSLVILREKDPLDFDNEYMYYQRIVYAHNRKQTKCALFIDDERHAFDCLVEHGAECVVLIPFY